MKHIYILLTLSILLGANLIKAQGFQNYELNTPYSDGFSDFIKFNNSYLLVASQFGINPDSATYNKHRNFLITLDKDGSNPYINYIDTFGIDKYLITATFFDNKIYTMGIDNVSSDTAMYPIITVYDTNFNKLTEVIYPSLKKEKLFFNQKTFLKDSILILLGNYRKEANLDFWSVLFQINLNTLNLEKSVFFDDQFLIKDYINVNDKTHVFAVSLFGVYGSFMYNTIVRYDSNFQLIDTTKLEYELHGNSNILPYKDSLYIISGRGINFWDFDPFNYTNRQLRLQVVDSNFRFVSAKSFSYNDSVDARPGYVQNLVQNSDGDYFAGAYLEDNFLQLHPESGILIVKLDSELNKIWQKHIPGNDSYTLGRIMATDDGGVLMIFEKGLPGYNPDPNYDAFFMKIGPNGEVTNITDLNFQNPKAIVNIYPNPTSDKLNISLLAKNHNIKEIVIYDLQFKEILKREINSPQTTIDVSKLAKGVYIVEGKTNTAESFMKKFVVE